MMDKLLDIAGVGGTVVLVLLLALSVISIGIILERLIYFRRRRIDAVKLSADVLGKLAIGDREAVTQRLRNLPGVEAAALHDAMGWYDAGPEAFTEILNKGLAERRKEFESGLVFLGTLGNNAPFVGLFGTVLGIIVRVSWFVSGGELAFDRTGRGEAELEMFADDVWTTPEPGPAYLWVVVRDSRGGVAFSGHSITIAP